MDVAKLLSRSQVADMLLKELREKVARLRQQVITAEVQRLTSENEQLSLQCEAWRQRLIKAETANGKKQYPLPTRCNSTNTVAHESKTPTTVEQSKRESSQLAAESEETTPKKSKKANESAKKPNQKDSSKEKNVDKSTKEAADSVCVSQLDLRIGLIKQIEKHPDADALYLEQVDVGEEKPRTILSGLVKFVPIGDMRDRMVVVMCNLKPAKMRGILSEGMLMCASTHEKVEPIRPPKNAVPGDRVTWVGLPAEGYPDPEPVLNPKKKIWERIAPDLKIDEQGHTVWMGQKLEIRGKGPLLADTLKGVNVK